MNPLVKLKIAKDFWSNSAPSATHVAWRRIPLHLKFDLKGSLYKRRRPQDRRHHFWTGLKTKGFLGASFPLKFNLPCQCSISGVKKHGVSWSMFPGRSFSICFFGRGFPCVSFTKTGSRGRKKAQESVGKDEDWVHSGHRLNLPLEARPEMELEAGDGDRVLKIQGPARVTGLTEKLLDGSSLIYSLCLFMYILLYTIYVYVTLVPQFNNPTVHSTRKQDVMDLNGTDPFACGSWDRTGAARVLCSTRARCAVFWRPDDGPVKTSPQLGLIGFTWVYMGLHGFTMVYHGLAIRIAIWLD